LKMQAHMVWVEWLTIASELHFTVHASCESHVHLRSAAFSDTKTSVQFPLSRLLHGAYSTACASCLHLHFLWQSGGRPHAHACAMSSHACSGAHRAAGASCLLLHALCQFGRQPRLQRHRPTGPCRKLQRAKSQSAKHKGPDQRQASRMLERTRASKTRTQNGGHQAVPKPGEKHE
jgi:hypothetical protein